MRRRRLLHGAGGLAAVGLVGPVLASQPTAPGATPTRETKFDMPGAIGLQLSTITPLMIKDFYGALDQVAALGYRQVEFSALGLLGQPVAKVQQHLADVGLAAPVGRVTPRLPENFYQLDRSQQRQLFQQRSGLDYLLDNVRHSLLQAEQMSQQYLVLPAIPAHYFTALPDIQRVIETLYEAVELCQASNVRFGYHNHAWELKPVGDRIPYDMLLDQVDDLDFQLDTYWIVNAGGDIKHYFETYPGRFTTCHLKDMNAGGLFEDVGYGQIDFTEVIPAATTAGVQYFFVERDNPPDPATSIRRSYQYLSAWVE